jgi:hypothetical protein
MFKSIVTAALIAVASFSVQAKAVAYLDLNQGRTSIVLHDESRTCAPGFLYAAIRYEGKPLNACWRVLSTPGGVGVHIIDEEGDEGLLPATAFQPVEDI